MTGGEWRCKWGCGKSFASMTLVTVHEKFNCKLRKKKIKPVPSKRVQKNRKPRGPDKRKGRRKGDT